MSVKYLPQDTHVTTFNDGACEHPTDSYFRIGSWATAVRCKPFGGKACFSEASGHVDGLDQTSTAAEIAGVLAVLRAAVAVKLHKPLVIFVDNRTAQRNTDRLLRRIAVVSRY